MLEFFTTDKQAQTCDPISNSIMLMRLVISGLVYFWQDGGGGSTIRW